MELLKWLAASGSAAGSVAAALEGLMMLGVSDRESQPFDFVWVES